MKLPYDLAINRCDGPKIKQIASIHIFCEVIVLKKYS